MGRQSQYDSSANIHDEVSASNKYERGRELISYFLGDEFRPIKHISTDFGEVRDSFAKLWKNHGDRIQNIDTIIGGIKLGFELKKGHPVDAENIYYFQIIVTEKELPVDGKYKITRLNEKLV